MEDNDKDDDNNNKDMNCLVSWYNPKSRFYQLTKQFKMIETWGFREDIKDAKGIGLMMMMMTMRRRTMRWRTTTRTTTTTTTRMTTMTRVSQFWD